MTVVKKSRRGLNIGIVVAVLLLVIGGGLAVRKVLNVPFKSSIRHEVNFVIVYPVVKTGFKIDKASQKYDKTTGVLSFVTHTTNSEVTFSEQAMPESFVDVPQAYDKLLEKMHSYQAFETANGKVALTRPEELHGTQLAVASTKGTLIFARAEPDLSADKWREIFNSAEIVK